MSDLPGILGAGFPPQQNGIRGILAPPQSMIEEARQQFPYLRDANVSYTETKPDNTGRLLEYWKPGDAGWDWNGRRFDRPSDLPLDTHGIEVLDKNAVKPIDILADYVSHHAVNEDPTLKTLYDLFGKATSDSTMRDRYDYHKSNLGEDRPYDTWYRATGLPELFRGYTFNQFGPNAERLYSPQQLKILDAVRSYLGITGK